jgi:TrmH family RNA methyltransferase
MGALLRTAEAAGVTRVLISEKSCDPFNPKAVRGAAGSVFRLPIEVHCSPIETLGKLKSRGIKIVAAHQDGALHYAKAEWKKPTALLVGAEGPGFNQDILQQVDATVKIPMQGKIESLNAGVAAALCMFEASRQRFAVEKS